MRRLDAEFADPVELDARSQIGIPGLVQAVRSGSVVLANPLGAGLLETRALLGFLPSLCHRLMGEELKLPNVATWWCGQASERAHVRENLDNLAIAPAFTRVAGWPLGQTPTPGANLDAAERIALDRVLDSRGYEVVGQEIIRLSTTPVWRDGRLEPRPFTMRVFVVATPEGWEVLPGGVLPRVGKRRSPGAVDAAGRALGRCLGDERRAGGAHDAAALQRQGRDQARPGLFAQQDRGKPVLAGPLSGARRGDLAGGPLPCRPRGREHRDQRPGARGAGARDRTALGLGRGRGRTPAREGRCGGRDRDRAAQSRS